MKVTIEPLYYVPVLPYILFKDARLGIGGQQIYRVLILLILLKTLKNL